MATAPGVATPEEYVADTLAREQTSLWADAWRRLKRNRLALGSAVFLVLLLVVAVISVFWTPYPIWRQGVAPTYQTPNSHFLLGADQAGRDMLSRLMVGAQVSLEVGVGTQIIVAAVGVTDRKSTRLNSSHLGISYAVFCLKKKIINTGNAFAAKMHNTLADPESTCRTKPCGLVAFIPVAYSPYEAARQEILHTLLPVHYLS